MSAIKPYFRRRPIGVRPRANNTSYTPAMIASLYGFPKVPAGGSDPTIAMIELGGGFKPDDVNAYFKALGLPAPRITVVGVDGAGNSPGDDADAEVELDIECAAAAYSACTGTPANILVAFAPNTDQGFADAVRLVASHPSRPAVLSISWGAPEDAWTTAAVGMMEAAFAACAAAGVSVFVASGDNGSSDGERGNHVDYPASSPQVVGCGGTTLHATDTAITSEVVWNDGARGGATGGGYSTRFTRPSWQSAVKGSMRGVPDLAGNADPDTGYQVIVSGQPGVIGGTSAVAPLMAALVALCARAAGSRFGLLHDRLYAHPEIFRDITQGNNGSFPAGAGWDASTGLGVPVGTRLLSVLAPTPVPTPTPVPVPTPTPTPDEPAQMVIIGKSGKETARYALTRIP